LNPQKIKQSSIYASCTKIGNFGQGLLGINKPKGYQIIFHCTCAFAAQNIAYGTVVVTSLLFMVESEEVCVITLDLFILINFFFWLG
jgi:hypothetical protein